MLQPWSEPGCSMPSAKAPRRIRTFNSNLEKEKVMTTNARTILLRTNAVFLLLASSWGLWADLSGAFLGVGPQRPILAAAPFAAIGFVEAHGLAFIFGVLLWRAEAARAW